MENFELIHTDYLSGTLRGCIMKNIRIYDNGGKSYDRYTVVFMDQPERAPNTFAALGMNGTPFHPLGFGQSCSAMPGRHLGRRISFATLPDDCQKLVKQYLEN